MDIETSKNDNNLDESYEEDNFEMNSEIIEEKTTPENYSTDEYNNIIMYMNYFVGDVAPDVTM